MVDKLTLKEQVKFDKLAILTLTRYSNWEKTADEALKLYPDACARCARCCMYTSSQFTDYELELMIKNSGMKPTEFVEKNTCLLSDGINRLKTPCPFLRHNECSIYNLRPKTCKNYPLNVPFALYDVEECALSKTIFNDLQQITESEFRECLDPLELDSTLLEKIKELNQSEQTNSRTALLNKFKEVADETMPKLENDQIIQIKSYSPAHFKALLKKKKMK